MTRAQAYFCWYWKSRRGKAAQKKYKQSAKGKATVKRANLKYAASDKGRAASQKRRRP